MWQCYIAVYSRKMNKCFYYIGAEHMTVFSCCTYVTVIAAWLQ